ncbi:MULTISPECIES: nucleotidyltransferase family protein [Deefgea]|uniref:Nitrate reductase n=1 Tax=Deefgea chitinilytica TaxID=570276 RepID=A0ABS2CEW2_9NEIS|nr:MULTISPECIES: nucleotidyltransferase family protein [Deefgea]MBM5572686.1 nitrate reductase [Deefgea chitinilytica]MBM9889922.1 nucleotidyltransferase family protein [Deefgea sp. CFH1-16]
MKKQTLALIQADPLRIDCLQAVQELRLPQAMICAGFIRNLIWDAAHQFSTSTPLNDVDVAWYSSEQLDPKFDLELEFQLKQQLPNVQWQVRNQARMHHRNAVVTYLSAKDAVERFPETATCLGISMNHNNDVEWCVTAGLADAWALRLRHNAHSGLALSVTQQRINEKNWLAHWPRLKCLPELLGLS